MAFILKPIATILRAIAHIIEALVPILRFIAYHIEAIAAILFPIAMRLAPCTSLVNIIPTLMPSESLHTTTKIRSR